MRAAVKTPPPKIPLILWLFWVADPFLLTRVFGDCFVVASVLPFVGKIGKRLWRQDSKFKMKLKLRVASSRSQFFFFDRADMADRSNRNVAIKREQRLLADYAEYEQRSHNSHNSHHSYLSLFTFHLSSFNNSASPVPNRSRLSRRCCWLSVVHCLWWRWWRGQNCNY